MKGFSIRLAMRPANLTGIQALDWRRSRGLSDGSRVYCDTGSVYFDVKDEAFIRLWFAAQEICAPGFVEMDSLLCNELVLNANNECVQISHDLPETRVQELFVASKFAEQKNILEHIKKQLEAAQALLDEEDKTE